MMLRYSSVCSAVATRRFFVGICFSFATVMQDFKIIDEYYPGIVGFCFFFQIICIIKINILNPYIKNVGQH